MKFAELDDGTRLRVSHPSRGAWIEMQRAARRISASRVAPLTGCVD